MTPRRVALPFSAPVHARRGIALGSSPTALFSGSTPRLSGRGDAAEGRGRSRRSGRALGVVTRLVTGRAGGRAGGRAPRPGRWHTSGVDLQPLPGAWALPGPYTVPPAGGEQHLRLRGDAGRRLRPARLPEHGRPAAGGLRARPAARPAAGGPPLRRALPRRDRRPGATAVPVARVPRGPRRRWRRSSRAPGGPPDARDLAQVRGRGAALGALHGALARGAGAPPGRPFPPAVTLLRPARRRPRPAGDPLRLDGLPLAPGQRERLDALVEGLRAAVPRSTPRCPGR